MDENTMYAMIQGQIGYTFKNRNLLTQALTRKSYSEENGGLNNEVLEFIGDKALDLIIVKFLSEEFGAIDNEGFHSQRNEGELTNIKARLVEKNNLSNKIEDLGFSDFLRMGVGDEIQGINKQKSVQEDLFEAIYGAVALDCNWNLNELFKVAQSMLDLDEFFENENNYVQLIVEWEAIKNSTVPFFKYYDFGPGSSYLIPEKNVVSESFSIADRIANPKNTTCLLKLLDDLPIFMAHGTSRRDAKKNVCKLAYEWLNKHDELFSIQDEIDNPNKNDAINQLETLSRRGYFPLPKYDFSQTHDKNGNPIWTATITLEGKSFKSKSSSKKDAKKECAFKMLNYVLEDD